jgi:hypothetical protein
VISIDLHINIKDLKVTEVGTSSGIFSGENYHAHWSAVSKTNTGLNLGDSNLSYNCVNMVSDPDVISMLNCTRN